MASRWRAIAVLFVLAVLPLTGLVAAGVLALVVLRFGLVEGLLVLTASAAGLLAAHLVIGGDPMQVIGVVAVSWLPVVILAAVLRGTGSQARTLALAGLLGCGAVVGVFAATGDPAPMWEQVMRERMLPFFEQAGVRFDHDEMVAALPDMARLMTGLAAAFWAAGHFVSVALGRWAQAILVNPGGFRTEFHALRLERITALVAGAVFVIATLTANPVLGNVALVLVIVYAVQGIAVMHGVVGRGKLHGAWLVPPYALMFVLAPHMIALLAVMGFIDRWVDFRGRIATQ